MAQELCAHPNLLRYLTKNKYLSLKELELLTGAKRKVIVSIIPMDNRQEDIVDQAKLRDSVGRQMLENNISAPDRKQDR